MRSRVVRVQHIRLISTPAHLDPVAARHGSKTPEESRVAEGDVFASHQAHLHLVGGKAWLAESVETRRRPTHTITNRSGLGPLRLLQDVWDVAAVRVKTRHSGVLVSEPRRPLVPSNARDRHIARESQHTCNANTVHVDPRHRHRVSRAAGISQVIQAGLMLQIGQERRSQSAIDCWTW